MSVLHVSQPVDGGVAGYVLAACADQVARGWDVAVACPDEGQLPEELARLGIRQLTWRAVRSPGPEAMTEARRLDQLIDRYGPRVVHLHASKAGLAGRVYPGRRPPVMFQPHGWSWLAVDGAMRTASVAWERAATRRTALFVCVGAQEAQEGRAHGVRGRYAVIRNGVDLQRFRPAGGTARRRARLLLGVGPDVPLAVCAGRLTRQKGQDVLLAAWPAIRAALPAAELALVGDGDLRESLIAGATPGVRFAGGVPDVRDWLAAADLVVVPSRWEGLPLIALEAMATGRSVVGSAIPGLVEVVQDSVGALVPPDDPAALAVALTRRLGRPGLSRVEGTAAARHAERFDTRHTHERLAATTLALAAGRLSDVDDQNHEGVPE
jgi:glycosyltransferase involved in cell wall biosynthesis